MDATFLQRIESDFPNLVFREGHKFTFRPPKTIIIGPSEENDEMLLLHEVGHAISGHRDFDTDIRRLKMEVEAWEKARELAPIYNIVIDEDAIEDELDTYRDFLHKKSRCPECGLTRFQTPDGNYHCPRCEAFKLSN